MSNLIGSGADQVPTNGMLGTSAFVDVGQMPVSDPQQASLDAKQATSEKDATGGYAGLTLFKLNMRNAANTITSWFTNANTVARTYTLQDRDGTLADNTDLALKANLASPTLTGVPAAPTAASATNTTQLATTAHVFAERTNTATLTNKTLNSPAVSGGTINDSSIGVTTPAPGSFTTLSATDNIKLLATSSTWSSAYKAVQVGHSAFVSRTSGADSYVLTNCYFDGLDYKYGNSNFATMYQQADGCHAWSSAPSGTVGTAVPFTERMRLDINGDLSVRGYLAYSRGNILGAVSQSAGVPTGAIIETVTSANGTATRWADGTMICTVIKQVSTASADTYATTPWTYPAVFSATPYLLAAIADYGTNQLLSPGVLSQTASGTDVVLVSGLTAVSANITVLAIGRWF